METLIIDQRNFAYIMGQVINKIIVLTYSRSPIDRPLRKSKNAFLCEAVEGSWLAFTRHGFEKLRESTALLGALGKWAPRLL